MGLHSPRGAQICSFLVDRFRNSRDFRKDDSATDSPRKKFWKAGHRPHKILTRQLATDAARLRLELGTRAALTMLRPPPARSPERPSPARKRRETEGSDDLEIKLRTRTRRPGDQTRTRRRASVINCYTNAYERVEEVRYPL